MKRSAFSPHAAARLGALALALGALFGPLAGCDTLNDMLAPDRVNYKDTSSAPPLEVPQGLSVTPASERYVSPPTTLALGGALAGVKTDAGNFTFGQPTAQDPLGMHVERDGDRRWLVVDGRTPEQLWQRLHDFWEENGFTLTTDSQVSGIMSTDWAENRAKIPDDWFRRTVGHLIDFVYSSGTRDRFQTLVTRGPDGQTDISITHSALEEVVTGPGHGDGSRWVERPRDPALEAVFLSKLMQKLGLTDAQSRQLLTDARESTAPAQVDAAADGGAVLVLPEPIERAWLRVGIALDRSNFTVDNADRDKGIYFVRYVDSTQELKGEGFFGKLFYHPRKDAKQAPQYMVAVSAAGDGQTRIAVVDANGQVDTSPTAQRIVSALHAQLN